MFIDSRRFTKVCRGAMGSWTLRVFEKNAGVFVEVSGWMFCFGISNSHFDVWGKCGCIKSKNNYYKAATVSVYDTEA